MGLDKVRIDLFVEASRDGILDVQRLNYTLLVAMYANDFTMASGAIDSVCSTGYVTGENETLKGKNTKNDGELQSRNVDLPNPSPRLYFDELTHTPDRRRCIDCYSAHGLLPSPRDQQLGCHFSRLFFLYFLSTPSESKTESIVQITLSIPNTKEYMLPFYSS
jgi:hypothetical protein